jgi:SAM-dependent methyltransferase
MARRYEALYDALLRGDRVDWPVVPTRRERLRAAAERTLRDSTPARRLRTQLASERLAAWGGDRPVRFLDAGCDIGLLSLVMARRCPSWTIEGVDINEEMLAMGREWAREEGLERVRLFQGDITGDLPADAYDVVAALECLTVIPDLEAAIAGLGRALRPGGLLAAHVPEADWEPVLPGSAREWRGELRHGFTPEGIAELLDRHGLRMTWVQATTRTPVQTAQELRDRIKASPTRVRLAAHPGLATAVWLERHGLAFGPARGLYFEAVRR